MPRKNKLRQSPARKLPIQCTKTAYKTKRQIEQVIIERRHNDMQLTSYLCPDCGKWHLTSR